ncbi:DoxX family protein [Bradyrhizobium sp.]|jgi:putative oxidoreductase|uniref:DoxX family protein n=1 Tax=Bradyrhizobium sp. TaxID=376 RepID=UPI002D705933|nr:DoxX family protein [Bradyrhizobium sp.]HZR74580.1 DoxX family protein [Bradyrhizobium sp.]
MAISETTATQDKVLLAARLLVTPLFIYSGIGKIMAFEVTAGRLPGGAGGFGSFLAAGSILIELGCSLAFILGIYTRCAALVLIAFTIIATLMFHNFWASPPAAVVGQTINFGKNLGLIGLFAMIWAFGPGNYALRK